ncbi:MAG: hypothetical protein M1820_004101 [Bogoriella megaspora]|nr:MAG: hypothetical protein M1820_004101 [Bogoriella megaspora]
MLLSKTILLAFLATSAVRVQGGNGPDNSYIQCGCDGIKDATIEYCQAAIDQIDITSPDVTDPTNGVGIGGVNVQKINGPGGVGGGVSGTLADGKTGHDLAQAMLDGCKDTENGKVNGCAWLNIEHGIFMGDP